MINSCYTFFKYFFRALYFIAISLADTLLSFLPQKLRGSWYFQLYRCWSLAFFHMYGVVEHKHALHVKPLPKQFIVISNHPSGIDVIWLPGRFNAVPLSKDDIKYWPVIGNITRAAGVIFVNRSEAQSRRSSLLSCLKEIKQGNSLLIFPEGGCLGKTLSPFHNGAFDLSHKTNVPVLPVYLHYEDEDTYEWGDIAAAPYVKRLLFKAKNRNAHLYIFDAINPQEFTNAAALKEHTFNFYKQLEQQYRH